MNFRRVFVWVEGPDDDRFVQAVIRPVLATKYDWIDVVQYATMSDQKILEFLRGITAMGADYIFSRDIDSFPCVTAVTSDLSRHLPPLAADRIVIVIREIESWYLALLGREAGRRTGLTPPGNTDFITKEDFDRLILRRYVSRIDFMLEILRRGSIDDARRQNTSFRYFATKHL